LLLEDVFVLAVTGLDAVVGGTGTPTVAPNAGTRAAEGAIVGPAIAEGGVSELEVASTEGGGMFAVGSATGGREDIFGW